MAIACAAADLLGRRALELDLVFVIEGEEEAGSGGFEQTIKNHKVRNTTYRLAIFPTHVFQGKIGPIDAILVR